jgi:methionine sulfoxide reductase catalytic subunit
MRPTRLPAPKASEITPLDVYLDRRRLLAGLAGGLLGLAAPTALPAGQLHYTRNTRFSTPEAANSLEDITTYNNFYEFGTSKEDPARLGGAFRPAPWSVTIAGEAEVTGKFTLEDILKPHPLEERI